MALVLADRVQETTTTTGTGAVTLAGAVTGFQTFAVIGNGNQTYYTIAEQTGGAWEVGIGTYTSSGTTLSRDTILSSSNSGSAVDFGAGTKNVFVTYPSGKSVNRDVAGDVTVAGSITGEELLASNGLVLNKDISATSYTFPSDYNGLSVGPHTVGSGATVTVAAGQRWVVI